MARSWKGTYSNLFDYNSDSPENYLQSLANIPLSQAGAITFVNREADKITTGYSEAPLSIVKFEEQKGSWFTFSPCGNP